MFNENLALFWLGDWSDEALDTLAELIARIKAQRLAAEAAEKDASC